jgi:hypothetical protein
MLRLQNASKSSVDNMNNVGSEASSHFRNKKKAYLKSKIEELETISKIKKKILGTSVILRRVTSLELI